MQVTGIDHVNIVAGDLDATAQFYADLLGLRRGETPGAALGFRGAWLIDAADRAIIHLMAWNEERHAGRDCAATGSIDHVALACRGFDAMLERCAALGVEHRVNDRKFGDLRQIFVTDPNNVTLELNFAGD
jgi:catechol 2,3-dioxygenase-like lactoylglutathione lyase family enzyme